MRKLLHEVAGFFVAAAGVCGGLYGFWFIWGEYFTASYFAVRSITSSSVMWAGAVGVAAASVRYWLVKRYSWAEHTLYYFLTLVFRGNVEAQAAYDTLSTGNRKYRNLRMFIFFTHSDHWLGQRVELWLMRIAYVLLWPFVILALAHSLQGDVTTPGGYAISVLGIVLIFGMSSMRLSNLLLVALFGSWLSYAILAWGGREGEAQAIVIGFGLALWTAWQEWQKRIAYPTDGQKPEPTP
jgi:hypothetical protein